MIRRFCEECGEEITGQDDNRDLCGCCAASDPPMNVNPVPGKRLDEMSDEEREQFYAYLNREPEDTQQYEAWGS